MTDVSGAAPAPGADASGAPGATPTPADAAATQAAALAAAEAAKTAANPAVPAAPVEAPTLGGDPAPNADLSAAQDGDSFTYEATGNDMLDIALDYVGKLGFGPTHPAMKAAGEGNWLLLEAEIAKLGDKAKGGDKFIAIAQKAIADEQTQATEHATKTRALCVSTFGGTEEQFDGMMKWMTTQANEGKITKEERDDLNRMLARGGFQAQTATQAIAAVYAKAGGVTITPAKTSGEAAAVNGADNGERFTSKSWAALNREMRAKYGANFEQRPEYKAAEQRARAQAGIR